MARQLDFISSQFRFLLFHVLLAIPAQQQSLELALSLRHFEISFLQLFNAKVDLLFMNYTVSAIHRRVSVTRCPPVEPVVSDMLLALRLPELVKSALLAAVRDLRLASDELGDLNLR